MLQIPLSPDTELLLRERALANGAEVSSYAAHLLTEALRARSVAELLAPFRAQVEASDVADEEIDALGESLRDEVWCERGAKEANGK